MVRMVKNCFHMCNIYSLRWRTSFSTQSSTIGWSEQISWWDTGLRRGVGWEELRDCVIVSSRDLIRAVKGRNLVTIVTAGQGNAKCEARAMASDLEKENLLWTTTRWLLTTWGIMRGERTSRRTRTRGESASRRTRMRGESTSRRTSKEICV